MSGAKRSVKVLRRDPERRFFVELEIDGRNVRVEKFTEEDWRELHEREKKENLSIECVRVGFIPFEKEGERAEDSIVFQRMALAAYRLLWYFSPPRPVSHTPPRSVYTFSLRYKEYIFEIEDDVALRWLDIHSIHLVSKGKEFDKQKYIPPKEIREEITSIIKHLAMTQLRCTQVTIWFQSRILPKVPCIYQTLPPHCISSANLGRRTSC